jgi:hypothetical protein
MLRPTLGGTVVAGCVAGVAEPLLAVVAVAARAVVAVRAAVVAVLPPPTDVAAASVDPVVAAAALVDVSACAVVDVDRLADAVVVVVRSDAETEPAFLELPPQPAAMTPKSATGMATRRHNLFIRVLPLLPRVGDADTYSARVRV